MLDFIGLLGDFFVDLWDTVESFPIFNNVGLMSLMLGFVALSIIITVFWKGARG